MIPSRKSPSLRLGPLAVRQRDRELRVAAAGRAREREGAAEARVDVRDRERAVRLAEALDVGGADDARSSPRPARRARSARQSLIVVPLIDSPPFDWIIVRGIAFRQRPSRSQKTSIENSSPAAALLHERVDRRVAEEEVELGAVGGAVDVPRAEALAAPSRAAGSGASAGTSSGSQLGGLGDAALLEEAGARGTCRRQRRQVSASGSSTSAGSSLRRSTASSVWSRSVSGTISRTSCSATSSRRRVDVARVVDAGDERVPVGVVEGGRERIDVGRDRRRPRAREGRRRCRRAVPRR